MIRPAIRRYGLAVGLVMLGVGLGHISPLAVKLAASNADLGAQGIIGYCEGAAEVDRLTYRARINSAIAARSRAYSVLIDCGE